MNRPPSNSAVYAALTVARFSHAAAALRPDPRQSLGYLRSLPPERLAALALDANPLDLLPMVQALAEALQGYTDDTQAKEEELEDEIDTARRELRSSEDALTRAEQRVEEMEAYYDAANARADALEAELQDLRGGL